MRRRICILSSFRVADRFGPGPEAVAEGRASGQGVCFSAPLATNLGPGPEAVEGAQVEAWLEEPAAAFGSGGSCWRSQECFDPSLSRMLCRRLCLTFAEKKTPGMERIGPTPTAFDRAGRPGGNDTGTAPAAAEERLRCWTASRYICVLARVGLYVRTCCCCWLRRVLLEISRMLCSVAVSGVMQLCPTRLTFAERKPGMERRGPTPTAFDRPAGPARAEQEEHLLQQQKAIAAGLDMCGVRQTLAGRLLLPYWTRSTPSFAP